MANEVSYKQSMCSNVVFKKMLFYGMRLQNRRENLAKTEIVDYILTILHKNHLLSFDRVRS